ncbi:hypothetical protein IE077_001843 [Cardiosporidium cionae]|uniref:Uncharacterized protein n=1 Tax=Cardiosporidium cionae TaxID=476202 RepID=A0ABQ7JCB2_9APIC|nr:hypothetical protein IE077_001843 [Cardiosporidium cionae]|eukprot:KAF8821583.1 hypothetical protein IE077_001843 [Cardiosporidium cionae]
MRLRFLFPSKGNPIFEFDCDTKYDDVLTKASELTGWSKQCIVLKNGFPPVSINSLPDTRLCELLQHGDGITVQHVDQVGFQAVSTRCPPKRLRPSNKADSSENKVATLSSPTCERIVKHCRKKKKSFGGTSDEWAENLVNLFSKSSGNLNSAEKALKGTFRNAVQRRYRSSLAEKRWAAVQSSRHSIVMMPDFKFRVTFFTGPRSKTTEEYVALPKGLMGPIVTEAYNNSDESRMNLRPYYLAEAQPLIFWNMVRFFHGDIIKGFMEVAPELDWKFVGERHRELSEKAKENLRQKKEAEASKKHSTRTKEKKEHELSSPIPSGVCNGIDSPLQQ